MKLAVSGDAKEGDGQAPVFHQCDDRRRHHVRGVGTNGQVDFVHVDEFGVDAGHRRRAALVVVVDEFHGASEQSAFGIDVVAPDFERQQQLLAVDCDTASKRHAEADADWLDVVVRGDRRQGRKRERGSGEQTTTKAGEDHSHSRRPPIAYFDGDGRRVRVTAARCRGATP
jgi:hypothetical protein